ncbi:MAG: serine/threonine protein kinase [Deltaproteobacteria bacterium]|nr:serine/threonine protein kinase [Deltaproteobacteria bacterium]
MDARIDDASPSEVFRRLTPEHCLDAVEVGGRRCTGRVFALNSYENRVYQFELEDGSSVVGKFYRPGRWSRDTILEEHTFLKDLAEEEIPVAVPIALAPGDTLAEVDGILYALFPRVRGRVPQELSDAEVRMVGRLLARLHNVGASRDAPHRLRLTPRTYGLDNLEALLDHDHLPPEVKDGYAFTVRALVERIEPYFRDVPVHRIHGDCHLGNLIWTDEGPTFLDFDDTLVGPAVQDVWMLLPSFDDEGHRQRKVLLEAYEEFRPFDPAWLRLVEPLRALRFVHYSCWIARRFGDAVFQRTFPHFGTVQYWQREVLDLREQIARIDNLNG